jgi:glutaconate CoA-transferase, subunit B
LKFGRLEILRGLYPCNDSGHHCINERDFTFWLQGGRIDVGFLGAALIDRFANINTTVIGPYARPAVRLPGRGPVAVISDLGILRPDNLSKELTPTSVHPGVTVDEVRSVTGWNLKVSESLEMTQAPTEDELMTLRELERRTIAVSMKGNRCERSFFV